MANCENEENHHVTITNFNKNTIIPNAKAVTTKTPFF